MRIWREQPGIATVFVVAVLALMSALMVALVSIVALDRSISENFLIRTRAVLIAESGIEYAVARVQEFQGGYLRPAEYDAMTWGGGVFDETQVSFAQPSAGPVPVSGYMESGTFTANGDYYQLWVSDESAKLNLNDSNGYWNPDSDPYLDADAEGDARPGAYAAVPDDADWTDRPRRLHWMLADLAERLFPGRGGAIADNVFALRDSLSGGRFTSMDQVQDALVDPANPGAVTLPQYPLTLAEFRMLRNYVTLHGWQDPNVIRPNFTVEVTVPSAAVSAHIASHADNFDIYTWRDYQTDEYELEPRSPVNVNTAPRVLLETLLAPLQGWYLREGPPSRITCKHYGSWAGGDSSRDYYAMKVYTGGPQQAQDLPPISRRPKLHHEFYFVDENNSVMFPEERDGTGEGAAVDASFYGEVSNKYGTLEQTLPLSAASVSFIADALYQRVHDGGFDINNSGSVDGTPLEQESPFRTWEEFQEFIRELYRSYWSLIGPADADLKVDTTLGRDIRIPASGDAPWWRKYYQAIYADLLIAAFNPNSDCNDYNPNRNLFRHVDKGQLSQYTTELCFAPMGNFGVRCRSAIESPDHAVIMEYLIDSVVQATVPVRFTTQSQFHAGAENGMPLSTWMSNATSATLFTHGYASAGSPGVTLQSYPEPYLSSRSEELSNARYDGQLMLASLQHNNDYIASKIKYRENYKDTLFPSGWSAGSRMAAADFIVESGASPHWSSGYNMPTTNPLTFVRTPSEEKGVLYPDGAFSEAGRTLAYSAPKLYSMPPTTHSPASPYVINDGRCGAISMWVKPCFHMGLSNRPRKFFSLEAGNVQPGTFFPSCHGLFYFPHGFQTGRNGQTPASPSLPKWDQDLYSTAATVGGTFNPAVYRTVATWLISHSIAYGWGYSPVLPPSPQQWNFANVNTWTVSHEWPGWVRPATESAAPKPITSAYRFSDFEGRTWSHLGFSWFMGLAPYTNDPSNPPIQPSTPCPSISIAVNGWNVFTDQQAYRWRCSNNANPPVSNNYLADSTDLSGPKPNYIRLGELDYSHSYRYVADSTIDEFVFHLDSCAYNPTTEAQNFDKPWFKGRYWNIANGNRTVGIYTSREIALADLGVFDANRRYRIRDVAWTLYWPWNNRIKPDLPSPNLNRTDILNVNSPLNGLYGVKGIVTVATDEEDPTLPIVTGSDRADAISVDAWTSQDDWAVGSESSKSQMPSFAGGSRIRRASDGQTLQIRPGEDFRFRVYFNLANTTQYLFESPVLDDLTFTFIPDKPIILSWKEIRD